MRWLSFLVSSACASAHDVTNVEESGLSGERWVDEPRTPL